MAKEQQLPTVSIQGKPYVEVEQRVKYFNETYPNGSIRTEIISHDAGVIVMKTTVWPDIDKPEHKFTGHAAEKEGAGMVNKTSYVENCETSAVGRALGMMAIGLTKGIASADEVQNAISQQADVVSVVNKVFAQKAEKVVTSDMAKCVDCGAPVPPKVLKYSMDRHNKALCFNCQKK